MSANVPTINEIRRLREEIDSFVQRTPMLPCPVLAERVGALEVTGKCEFLQTTGTFKARGALASIAALAPAARERGVIAVSAGNHAIATAFAARALGTTAHVVMTRSANPARVDACRRFGGDIEFADDVHTAFERAREIERDEGRFLIHPFEGPAIATGTGTIGLEIHEQAGELDAVIVSIGGGGLMAGIASALKQLRPGIEVVGVEPEGADSMHRSFAAGEPRPIERVQTIADSLGAPYAEPYSYAVCRANVDRLVKVSDDQLRAAMGLLFRELKLAVEPACAASTAALLGPLAEWAARRRIAILFCGSNIDWATFAEQADLD